MPTPLPGSPSSGCRGCPQGALGTRHCFRSRSRGVPNGLRQHRCSRPRSSQRDQRRVTHDKMTENRGHRPPQPVPRALPAACPQAPGHGLRGSQWSYNPIKNPISAGRGRMRSLSTSPAPPGYTADPGPPDVPSPVPCTRTGPPRGQDATSQGPAGDDSDSSATSSCSIVAASRGQNTGRAHRQQPHTQLSPCSPPKKASS